MDTAAKLMEEERRYRGEGHPPRRGSISLYIGPMMSEKSTALLRQVRREARARRRCVIIKHLEDRRYDGGSTSPHFTTHDGVKLEETDYVRICSLERLSELELRADETVVAVDEGQFFPDLVSTTVAWATDGRIVFVAALDGDYQRQPFGQVCALVPHCEEVTKLSGVCSRCGNDSSFTFRHSAETGIKVIGGGDKYHSVCRACYNALSKGAQ